MRFARYFVRADTGEIVAVAEQETPFENSFVRCDQVAIEPHDLGLIEDFEPVSVSGLPCLPSTHIFERIERQGSGYGAKPGHELPPIIDCPATLEGIKQRLRERGPEGIPAKARAWLALMLPSDQVEAFGVGRGIPLSALKALDDLRVRRDPSVGSRRVVLERKAQQQADAIAERASSQRPNEGTV